MRHKELRSPRITPCMSHAQRSRKVNTGILGETLTFNGVTWSAKSIIFRIVVFGIGVSALNHEVRNDTMELDSVKKTTLN